MYHVDNPSTVTEMPKITAVQNAITQWFTDKEGGDGAPTYPGAEWFNIIQAELLAILDAAGITPDKNDNAQIVRAIRSLIGVKSLNAGKTEAFGIQSRPETDYWQINAAQFVAYRNAATETLMMLECIPEPGEVQRADILSVREYLAALAVTDFGVAAPAWPVLPESVIL